MSIALAGKSANESNYLLVEMFSHIDEQAGHRVPPEGQETIHGGLASSIFGTEYALTQPGTRRRGSM
jgi:hypothetical protein